MMRKKPMLAYPVSDKPIDYTQPVFMQPKLDGVRCLFTKDGAFSRAGNQFMNVEHIEYDLKPVFNRYPNLILDGELYNHGLKDDFNKIISLVKKKKPTIKKQTDEPVKLDMNAFGEQKQENTVDAVVDLNEPKQETTDGAVDNARVEGSDEATTATPQQEEVQPQAETQEQPAVIQEVTEQEVAQVVDQVEEAVAEAAER